MAITIMPETASTISRVWSEQYDRELADVFALQDDISQKILVAMDVTIGEGEQARIRRRQTDSPEAHLLWLRGMKEFRNFNKPGMIRARQLNYEALELDPNFGFAIVIIGWTHHIEARYGWSKDPPGDFAKAEILARKALTLDETNADAYSLLSLSVMLNGEFEQAIEFGEKAIAFEPNHAVSTALLAQTLMFAGRAPEALALIQRAMRLSPYYPSFFPSILGDSYRLLGRYEDAISAFETSREMNPRPLLSHLRLSYAYLEAGHEEKAKLSVVEVLKRSPKFSLESVPKAIPFKDPAELARVLKLLEQAGIPAHPPLPLSDKRRQR